MNTYRNSQTGRFISAEQAALQAQGLSTQSELPSGYEQPDNWNQMTTDERQEHNNEQARLYQEEQDSNNRLAQAEVQDTLHQTLLQAVAITGVAPVEQALYNLGLDVSQQDDTYVLSKDSSPLYHIPSQHNLSSLQKAQAIDTIAQSLDKQGPEARAAAQALRQSVLTDRNNMLF